MNTLNRWRFAGIITISILGFLLHYVYSWTGSSKIIGLFVPVNESVWEHLKLGYWSVAIFSSAEYLRIRSRVNNYCFARVIGVVTLEITILIIFAVYTSFTGKNILLLDIFSYLMGVVICQYLTWFLIRLKPFPKPLNTISLAAFIALGVLFGVTTYYPPHKNLFKDHHSNTYGINKEK